MVDDNTPDEPFAANFRQNMRKRREGLGLSQSELARLIRDKGPAFHQQTVARIESGDRPIRLDEAYLIAAALRSSIESLSISDATERFQRSLAYMTSAQDALRQIVGEYVQCQLALALAADADPQLSQADRDRVAGWMRADAGTFTLAAYRDALLRAEKEPDAQGFVDELQREWSRILTDLERD